MATISTSTFEPVYFSGGYKLHPSYLEKSNFKQIQQIKDDEGEPDEITIGGYSVLNATSQIGLNTRRISGGNGTNSFQHMEGLTPISHLSIPVGLVITKTYSKNCYGNDLENLECKVIEDQNFDRLYDMTHSENKPQNKNRKTKSKMVDKKVSDEKKRTTKKSKHTK
jgi:hypothetical protein